MFKYLERKVRDENAGETHDQLIVELIVKTKIMEFALFITSIAVLLLTIGK